MEQMELMEQMEQISANGAKWYYNSGAPTVTPPTGAVNGDWYLDYYI